MRSLKQAVGIDHPYLCVIRFLIIGSLAFGGCKEAKREVLTSSPGGEVSGGEVSGGEVSGGDVVPRFTSVRPSLKRKDYRMISADLVQVLELTPNELCNELGSFPCLEQVHRVTLGGVSAEQQGIYQPVKESPITAPAALERVIYSACGTRVTRDVTSGGSGLFSALPIGQGGRLVDPRAPAVSDVLTELIRRAL